MKLIKVAAAVVNQTPLDWEGNKARILAALEAAKAEGASLICLPELCVTGYGCEDAFHSPGVVDTAWRVLEEILPATEGVIASLGLPLLHGNALFNAACLAADGRILGFVAKRYLAGDGLHYEPRWFKPWPEGEQVAHTADGRSYPLGDLYFDCGGVRIGFEICRDAWYFDRPGSRLARKAVDVILNPSASHFAFGKDEIRRRFVLEGSRAFCCAYVYSNLLGNEAGRAIYEGGAMIATGGRLVAAGPRFAFADWSVASAVVDLAVNRMARAQLASFQPDLGDESGPRRVAAPFTFPDREPGPADHAGPVRAPWEGGPRAKEEEFTRAVALALFDYQRKSRSRGFVVSLSGGADSAATACLVAAMARLGVRELGLPAFLAKLRYGREIQDGGDLGDLIRQLLTCVYQATRNSSETTRAAAREVAAALGAEFHELDVDPLVEGYQERVARALGRELSWERDDIALQNIQARVRSPGVWLLANLKGAILLATSNRSEAAVGYATMDGDTSGGLSPIAGIDKAFLRRWLRWLESEGPEGLGPIPALAAVNRQAPTAELRPQAAAQTDEGDLMPYEVLDAIERAAIRDKKLPLEVYLLMRARFPEAAPDQLGAWVERFFRLWCRNQWKRERYAPSFHLDDENLDPKTWCRFPILSGGFERELAELEAYVAEREVAVKAR